MLKNLKVMKFVSDRVKKLKTFSDICACFKP